VRLLVGHEPNLRNNIQHNSHAEKRGFFIHCSMNIKNFEFKAKVESLAPYENKLLSLNPTFTGTDHQIDTYFNATKGRLKLRQGNIENALIQYERKNIKGSKESDIILYKHKPDNALKEILTNQLGVLVEVDKLRKIYFINNIKFHFDEVKTSALL